MLFPPEGHNNLRLALGLCMLGSSLDLQSIDILDLSQFF
jgi:hypothetical protein